MSAEPAALRALVAWRNGQIAHLPSGSQTKLRHALERAADALIEEWERDPVAVALARIEGDGRQAEAWRQP